MRSYDRSYSGHAQSVFNSPAALPLFSTPFTARVIRDSITPAFLDQNSAYFQDTYSRKRLTAILGLRWDRQVDNVAAVSAPAHAFEGQKTIDGTPFNLFPALDVPAVRAGVVWNTFAPRLGLTYDLTGDARNVIKGSYAIYFDQRSAGQLSKALNPVGAARIDLGWTDLNGDRVVQVNEINQNLIRSVTGFDPANPARLVSTNTVDPGVTALAPTRSSSGSARRWRAVLDSTPATCGGGYNNFIWQDTVGLSSADYSAVSFTPPASACPSGARCAPVTYFVPNVTLPSAYTVTNQPDFRHIYNGLELVVRKRSSRGWMLNGSYSYNTTNEYYDSAAAYEDPTNITQRNGFQYAPDRWNRRRRRVEPGGHRDQREVDRQAEWVIPAPVRHQRGGDRRFASGLPVPASCQYCLATQSSGGDRSAARPGRCRTIPKLRDDGLPAG